MEIPAGERARSTRIARSGRLASATNRHSNGRLRRIAKIWFGLLLLPRSVSRPPEPELESL